MLEVLFHLQQGIAGCWRCFFTSSMIFFDFAGCWRWFIIYILVPIKHLKLNPSVAQLGPTLGSDLTSKKAKVEADSRNHTRIYHQRLTPFDTHEKNISFFVPVIGSCRKVGSLDCYKRYSCKKKSIYMCIYITV